MSELEKAARQALEALEYWKTSPETCGFTCQAEDTITALRRALEQPAIKQSLTTEQPSQQCQHRIADARNLAVQSGYVCIDCGALFAAADHYEQPAQDEPVAWRSEEMYSPDVGSWFEYYDEFRQCSYRNDLTPLYTRPAREPLTMQPIIKDEHGTLRFKKNGLVDALYEHGVKTGLGLNELHCMDFTDEDRQQFAQLIGYSVSGYGSLSYVTDEAYKAAEQAAHGIKGEA